MSKRLNAIGLGAVLGGAALLGLAFWVGRSTASSASPRAAQSPVAAASVELTPTAAAASASATVAAPTSTATVAATTVADARQREYDRLGTVRAGMYIGRFEDAFGTPLLIRVSKDGTRIEKTFAGPEYFVQAIQDTAGTVHLMAVTSCSPDFQPRFPVPDGQLAQPGGRPLTLSRTLMKDTFVPTERVYAVGGTANTYIYDIVYAGNPGGYKTYIAGADDACNFRVSPAALQKFAAGERTPRDISDPDVLALRASSVINTYAETDSGSSIATALGSDPSFQIGVDRIRVRTLPESALVPVKR